MYSSSYQGQYERQGPTQYPNQFKPSEKMDTDYASAETISPIQQSLRVNFTRKVLVITAAQLLVTGLFVHFFTSHWLFYKMNYYFQGFVGLAGIVAALISLALAFSQTLSRKVPLNYILLGIFTLAQSYCVGFLAAHYDRDTVVMAMYLTAAVVGSLAIYALRTKTEITYYGGLLVLLGMGSLALTFMAWITRFDFLSSLTFAAGCVMSGLYLIYDIKLIMGNDRIKLSLDDYIKGAMHLYIDIIRIFINILKLLNQRAEEEENKRKRRR